MSIDQTYLSIDLDYWNGRQFPERWFTNLLKLNVPIRVWQHHHLVKHARKFQWHTLWNLDEHSDLVDKIGKLRLDEGSWVNFLANQGKRYVWSCGSWNRSYEQALGFCHGAGENPFECSDPVKCCGWEWVVAQEGHQGLKLNKVVAVGISVSEYWTNHSIVYPFYQWVREHDQLEISSFLTRKVGGLPST